MVTPTSAPPDEATRNEAHNEKMRKIKAARDKLMATKTEEKGLIVVHWSLRAVCAGGVFIGAGAAAPHAQAVRGDEAEPARPDGPQEGPEWAE